MRGGSISWAVLPGTGFLPFDGRRVRGLGGASLREVCDGEDGGEIGTTGGGRGGIGLVAMIGGDGIGIGALCTPTVDGVLRDLEKESPPLPVLTFLCSPSFNVNFENILCNRPPFALLGVSKDIELPPAPTPIGTSGMSGGPSARKSIRSRAPADTGYGAFCLVDLSDCFTTSGASSSDAPPITSSKSIDSLLRTTLRVRIGVPVIGSICWEGITRLWV